MSDCDLAECDGCKVQGICCYFRVEISGRTFVTDVPCPFLDLKTKLCKRYETRLAVPWCREASAIAQVPECVPHFDADKGVVEIFEDPEIAYQMAKQVVDEMLARVANATSKGMVLD